jgi:hypothetical protein
MFWLRANAIRGLWKLVPSTRGRLFGDPPFSFEPGDWGRWPFMSICEPSLCICADIMAWFFIWFMFAMGLPLLCGR